MSDSERIPLHRPDIGEEEIAAVTAVLRSGWLTTGAHCRAFESEFAAFVGAKFGVALNSATAALHLALDAVGCKRGDRVLVPTLTFAATAEVVAYFGATPVLVDCERETLNIDVAAAERTASALREGKAVAGVPAAARGEGRLLAILPVHYGGQMVDVEAVASLAKRHELRVIEDAAHTLPSSVRLASGEWRDVGTTAEQTCFSFYANKTITTGEGGMLVTDDEQIAQKVRRMSLHGLSRDAWNRFAIGGTWDYRILAPGFKYNLTDIAAALGREQLKRAVKLRDERARVARRYHELLGDVGEVELPIERADRRHSWHLFVMRVRTEKLAIDRNRFIEELGKLGIGTSVHYRPLHLHPYYQETFGYRAEDFPVASAEWERFISLPIFPSMGEAEIGRVVGAVKKIVAEHKKARSA